METRKPFDKEEKNLLTREEDHFFDVKSVRSIPASIQPDFAAFANSDGGNLYVGIEDRKTVGERVIGFKTIEGANDLLKLLLEDTNPAVENVDVEFIDFGARGYVLHLSIPKSPRVHYTSKEECYIRINASTVRIKGERITQLGYTKGSFNYERQPVDHVSIEDIMDNSHLERYMERIETGQGKERFLRKQRLITKKNGENHPNVGCVLLFDEKPQASLDTRCAIKVYRLRTTDKEYKREYLEDMPDTINGPIEDQIYKVIEAVEHILQDVSYREGDKLVRRRYPSEALKEILVNAVIHRDYSLNDDIHVRIFDNRIEIQSPGRLPGYITVQNIFDERYSRNPNIVRLLHDLPNPVNHDIGEGLDTARNELKRAGLVDPEITELENAVLITIKHQRIATLEDTIMDYLEENEFITNRIVRELSGEDDVNKVKKVFQKLRASGSIAPEDEKANPFDFRYRLKPKL